MRRVGGVERAWAGAERSNTIARRMVVVCEADDGPVGWDPPKMTKGGQRTKNTKKIEAHNTTRPLSLKWG